MADSLATMRSAAATLYASWERCSRFWRRSKLPRPPAGRQPVSHWQTSRGASDAQQWYHKAQHWLGNNVGRADLTQAGYGRLDLPRSAAASPRGARAAYHASGLSTPRPLSPRPPSAHPLSPRPLSPRVATGRSSPLTAMGSFERAAAEGLLTEPHSLPPVGFGHTDEPSDEHLQTFVTALEPHVEAVNRAPVADQPSSPSLPPSPVSIPVPAIARPMTSPAAASYSAGGGIDGRFRHPAAAFLLQRSDVARAAPSNSW